MIINRIEAGIQAIEEDLAIYEEKNFNSRTDAIDFIDFHITDQIEGLLNQTTESAKALNALKQRAEKLKNQLEKINTDLFKQFREQVSTGIYTGAAFTEMIRTYMRDRTDDISPEEVPVTDGPDQPDKIGYDNLDVFINGLLSDQAIPETELEREPEMVFYQKTPARIIFRMTKLAQLRPNDVFFDIGSGLGQVAILVNLASGAAARGIEYEPAYCDYAKACALRLRLSNVEFINADARKGDYSRGTVFFLYTPFEGHMLQDMLERLETEARKRTIRIFTYGPCSPHVARQHWLHCVNGKADEHVKLYEFIPVFTF